MSVHIEAKAGEIADKILLPGDPLRAKYIAETFLEDPICYNNVRGCWAIQAFIRASGSLSKEPAWACLQRVSMPMN